MNDAKYKSLLKADIQFCIDYIKNFTLFISNDEYFKNENLKNKEENDKENDLLFIEKIQNIIEEKNKEKINDFKFKLLSWSITIKNRNFYDELKQELYDRLIESTGEYLNLI